MAKSRLDREQKGLATKIECTMLVDEKLFVKSLQN